MVRRARSADLDAIADIWLHTNLSAQSFVPARYWRDNFQRVREMFPQAELYVWEDGNGIQGFLGLMEDYIAGLFVRDGARSGGIGRQLMDFVKGIRRRLTLQVYRKNVRAIRFYRREGFQVQGEQTDGETGEQEYLMLWEKKPEDL